MSVIDFIALLAAVIVVSKIAILIKHQRFWYGNVTRRYWKGSGTLTMIVSFAVAAGTLLFLLQELTIVQIWAAVFFGMAITSMALAPFAKYMLEVEGKWFSEPSTLKTGWFPGLVWIALSLWVLIALSRKIFLASS